MQPPWAQTRHRVSKVGNIAVMICRNRKDKGACQTEIEAKKRLYLAGESSSLVGWLVGWSIR